MRCPQLRVLVAPTRVCQLVTPALEERCEALGQAGKDNDTVCAGAFFGQVVSDAARLRLQAAQQAMQSHDTSSGQIVRSSCQLDMRAGRSRIRDCIAPTCLFCVCALMLVVL